MNALHKRSRNALTVTLGLLLALGAVGERDAVAASVQDASGETKTVRVSIPLQFQATKIVSGEGGNRIFVSGCEDRGDVGKPAVPGRVIRYVLPPGAHVGSVDVKLEGVETERIVTGTLRPMPRPYSPSVPETLTELPPSDLNAGPYPKAYLGDVRVSRFRQWKILEIPVSAAKYWPDKGEVELMQSGRILIEYIETLPPESERVDDNPVIAGAERLRQIIGEQGVQPLDDLRDMIDGYFGILEGPKFGYDILLLTTAAIDSERDENGLQKFIDHKRRMGFSVLTVTVSSIYSAYSTGSHQEKIKKYIESVYERWGIQYVLLVGNPDPFAFYANATAYDPGVVPMLRCETDLSGSGASDGEHGYSMTDTYYGDLYRSWDNDGDGKFGESWSAMDSPDLYVGRIAPCGGYIDGFEMYGVFNSYCRKRKLSQVFERIIKWDLELDPSWRYNMLMGGSYLRGRHFYYTWAITLDATVEAIQDVDAGFGATTVYQNGMRYALYDPWFDGHPNPEADIDLVGGTNSSFCSEWENSSSGYGLIGIAAHGSYEHVAVGYGSMSEGRMQHKDKVYSWGQNRPGVVFAASCSAMTPGTIEYAKGEYDEQRLCWGNLATMWQMEAAIAVVGATHYSYGDAAPQSSPVIGTVDWLQRRFFEGVARNEPFGQAWASTLDELQSAFSSGDKERLLNYERFNLLADPSQTFWGLAHTIADDAYDAGVGNDTAANATVVYNAALDKGFGSGTFDELTVEVPNLVNLDDDWYVLRALGDAEKRVAYWYSADFLSDLDLTFYDADGRELVVSRISWDGGRVSSYTDMTTTRTIYLRVRGDYANRYSLRFYIDGDYEPSLIAYEADLHL